MSTTAMKKKPDLDAFREGSSENLTKTTKEHVIKTPTNERHTKTIRLSKAIEMQIKSIVFHRTMNGEKITESDVIEEALTSYINKYLIKYKLI